MNADEIARHIVELEKRRRELARSLHKTDIELDHLLQHYDAMRSQEAHVSPLTPGAMKRFASVPHPDSECRVNESVPLGFEVARCSHRKWVGVVNGEVQCILAEGHVEEHTF